ncbi:uncharacterized protein NDAI_0G05310 [Naumovozyma dairenensis CBS 421]|uniref:WHIM1 domain-containing protein n=1 Tax=Naumovozyma dairenensis (strain ATCC 10597 / BCRC 20456 / CBS 421 / NBRC 0211 / NRRL Y-12639) TaxID=1071378 RepID=J7REH7_NAUDC|nr:hypothetical protein NDAI_0G05310 [Naumovozyma dairenensis CBS 421]CCK73514.1 hypothetical protein NDAI_0G05310 [Naumovozyma dairenensis CBS 421]
MSDIVNIDSDGSADLEVDEKHDKEGKQDKISAMKISKELKRKKQKRKGQLTFDDFKNVKVVNSPDVLSTKTIISNKNRTVLTVDEQNTKTGSENKENYLDDQSKTPSSTSSPSICNISKLVGLHKQGQTTTNLHLISNWASSVPLELKSYNDYDNKIFGLLSRANTDTKPIPYAGPIISIMAFINKFHKFFSNDILDISFQVFEIGLELTEQQDTSLSNKCVTISQEKMNLLFFTFLKLLFPPASKKHYSPPSMAELKSSKKALFNKKIIHQLRTKAIEWGYPKKWRVPVPKDIDVTQPLSYLLTPDEEDTTLVDPTHPEILTKNIPQWYKNTPLPNDENLLYNPNLEKMGVFAFEPKDRLIFLEILMRWCCSNSTLIHDEIYRLSHLKKEPSFGIYTQHVPRYLVNGIDESYDAFHKVCRLLQKRLLNRRKNKYQMNDAKKKDLSEKIIIVQELMKELKTTAVASDKSDIPFKSYQEWSDIFERESIDDPLSNPFNDDSYKLRMNEFFVGTVDHVGDFFLPRLHSYGNDSNTIGFCSVKQFLEKSNNDIQTNQLSSFRRVRGKFSLNFKLLLHAKSKLTKDSLSSKADVYDGDYWYEISHDYKSLDQYVSRISKIFQDYSVSKESAIKGMPQDENYLNDPKFENVLLQVRYLTEYLSKLSSILKKLEQLQSEHDEDKYEDRKTRSSRRSHGSYKEAYELQDDEEEYIADNGHDGIGAAEEDQSAYESQETVDNNDAYIDMSENPDIESADEANVSSSKQAHEASVSRSQRSLRRAKRRKESE